MRVEQSTALLAEDPVALFAVSNRMQRSGLRLLATESAALVLRMRDTPDSVRNRARNRVAAYLSAHQLDGHALLRIPDSSVGEVRLTPREREISELIDSGLSNAEIADRLTLSIATVEGHITRIYRKTGARRRAPARR